MVAPEDSAGEIPPPPLAAESFPLILPNVPLLIPPVTPAPPPPAGTGRTPTPPLPLMLDDEDEELELSPDFASSGRSRSSAMMSSRLIELLTSLLLMALLTADGLLLDVAESSRLLLPPMDDTAADSEEEGVADPPAPGEEVVVGVELVVEDALPSVEDCCLRFRYSVMESLRFGVIGALAGLVPVVAEDASAPVEAATSAGLSRGSELAVLVNIFGYAPPMAGIPPVGDGPVGVILPPTMHAEAVLPRVDRDSVVPSRSDDFTLPTVPPANGDVRDPRVEKLVGR